MTQPNYSVYNDGRFTNLNVLKNGIIGGNLTVGGNIITNTGAPLSQPYVFTFCPNYVGTNSLIFSTWTALYTQFSKVTGPKVIYFNGTGGTLIIPPGTYNMDDTTWEICFSDFTTIGTTVPRQHVVIQNGVTFTGHLCSISGPFAIEYQGTSSPAFLYNLDTTNRNGFVMERGAGIFCTGTQPFIKITSTAPSSFIFLLDNGASLGLSSNPSTVPIILVDNIFCIIDTFGYAVVSDNSISGNAQFILVSLSPGLVKGDGQPFEYPSFQPAITGSLGYARFYNLVFQKTVAPTVNDDQQYYNVGDTWINIITNDIYICTNNSSGSAIWIIIS